MGNRYLFSDPHHGHNGLYKMTGPDGGPLRPWADNAAEADEMMVDAWNRTVNDLDIVYHLGDAAMNKKSLAILGRLKGRKILYGGNHDHFKLADYAPYFEAIYGCQKVGMLYLSHAPMHPASIPPWCHANVHGHIHAHHVTRTLDDGTRVPDTRYINMCVEVAGLAPVPFEEVAERARVAYEMRTS